MHSRLARVLSVAAAGLALTCSVAQAQLQLSGRTTGWFTDFGQPNTTVVNAADGSSAWFATGIPYLDSTQSSILFEGQSFTNVGSGDPIHVGLFTITNGITLLGSAAAEAEFQLGLELTSPVSDSLFLSTLTFAIDNTPNGGVVGEGGGVPDSFGVTFVQPAPIKIGDSWVQFSIVYDPLETAVPEGESIVRGDIYVTFTPIPEPSTYALGGALLLVGVVAYRRFRKPGTAAAA